MRVLLWHSLTLTACAAALSSVSALEDRDVIAKVSTDVKNANHVFNAVRGAMRQWDSSWNHNGMSFFLAEVPEGTQLYHGTGREEAIEGMEWLAFEPEHALMFAHGRGPPRGPGKGKDGKPDRRMPRPRSEQDILGPGEDQWPECPPHSPPTGDRPHEKDPHHGRIPPPPPPMGHPGDKNGPHHVPRPPPPPPKHDSDRRPQPPDGPPPPPQHGVHEEAYQDRPPYGVVDERVKADKKHRPPVPPPHGPRQDCGSWAGDPSKMPPPPPPSHKPDHESYRHLPFHDSQRLEAPHNADDSQPPPPPGRDANATGYLHFYRTLHPLRLLLIDGMSAGKTAKGTLDSQDYVLWAGMNNSDSPHSPFLDGTRAEAMCNRTRDEWNSRVDGFIRMEAGFEIILCNFSAHLHLDRAQKVKRDDGDLAIGVDSGFQYFKAIADRYHGIGGGRVIVDFANMVSAYNTDMELFVNDSIISNNLIPRLENQSVSDLAAVQDAVARMVMGPAPRSKIDWQSIADMLVQRYGDALQYLAEPGTSESDFSLTLRALMRPFISDGESSEEAKIQRCVDQVVPQSWSSTLAGQVVKEVSSTLCSALITVVTEVAEQGSITKARNDIKDLVEYLNWPLWHGCRPSCAVNEVCVLPIWPLTSSVKDRVQPKCKNATEFGKQRGPGPGPGRGRSDGDDYWYGNEKPMRPPPA